MKQLVAFDLDGTLAESKQPLGDDMAAWLGRLLGVAKVCVISGGDWPQFEKQVVSRLPADAPLEGLFIMPTTGTKLYRFQGGSWHAIYAELFSKEEHDKILSAFDKALSDAGLKEERTWGDRIEDRGSQVTFSGLGQEAPLDAKKAWDPGFAKRRKLQQTLQSALPDLAINIGGSTSIDITRKGIDKAYGMRRLTEHSGVAPENILFMGDAIFPGGNDDPVRAMGIDSIKVRDVADTITAVTAVIACLKP
ncbi:HAD-IIB family hydrolase [Sphingomonas bacterium]|uniref:HAD-IIB family hydrolase n=1 Tax=Sphingomonas bacterium TaxID=1895847 RepID=UPI0015750071|nr:HAD-IIB family hydrolase [Sphingomonas bacterium]